MIFSWDRWTRTGICADLQQTAPPARAGIEAGYWQEVAEQATDPKRRRRAAAISAGYQSRQKEGA